MSRRIIGLKRQVFRQGKKLVRLVVYCGNTRSFPELVSELGKDDSWDGTEASPSYSTHAMLHRTRYVLQYPSWDIAPFRS
jgi:hypothetical protein